MNYEIRKFQEDLVALINGAQLPIEVKRLVLENIMQSVNNVSEQVIKQEKEQEVKADGISENNMAE